MSNAEKINELVNAFNSLNEKDQERLVYIAEGMRIAQGNTVPPVATTPA